MRRLLLVAVLAVAGSSSAAATTPSGLYGFVRRGPIVPVCTAEGPCDGPARSFPLVFWRNGKVVGRTRTTSTTGAYRIRLAPGLYTVRSSAQTTIGRGAEPRSARVVTGRFRRVDFFFDTGIR
jgi:hypothetical protein